MQAGKNQGTSFSGWPCTSELDDDEEGVQSPYFNFETGFVEESLLRSGLKPGAEFIVNRVKGAQVEVSILGKQEPDEPKEDNLRELMMRSVVDADHILKNCGVQVSDEVQKLSTALFIARTKVF